VRNRWLDSVTGVWNRRDPLGYIDGMNLYQYVRGMALVGVDPTGLFQVRCAPLPPRPDWGGGSDMLARCLNDPAAGPTIQQLLHEMMAAGCQLPRIYTDSGCGSNRRNPGNYCPNRPLPQVGPPDPPDICIRVGEDCASLVHELVHARQHCTGGDDWINEYFNTFDGCFRHEREAYELTRECERLAPQHGVTVEFCLCVGICGSCTRQYQATPPAECQGMTCRECCMQRLVVVPGVKPAVGVSVAHD
jgi:hypothetical protein